MCYTKAINFPVYFIPEPWNASAQRKGRVIMPLLKEQNYTIDDIYKLPEGERAELIDGQIYNIAPPRYVHQLILNELNSVIHQYIKSKNGSCKVLPAPFAVFLNNDNKTYVEPDISVICDKNKLDEYGCHGAPDWIIEIVSPGQQKNGLLYKTFKIQYLWCQGILDC